jgi:hypothetical protein
MTDVTPTDPVAQLMQDHRTALSLVGTVRRETGEVRTEALRELVRQLSIHAAVEEMAVYPAMRRAFPNGDEIVDADLADHQQMKEILARLDKADPEDAQVTADVEALGTALEAHVTDEELQLAELRESLPPQAYTELGQAAEKARSAAPTRPHPHAPDGGLGATVAGGAASLVDKARDAMRRD